jgi:hypothetical protein
MVLQGKALARLLAGLAVIAVLGFSPGAVAQPKSYLLFFDYEKTDIVPTGKDIIDAVASAIKAGNKSVKVVLVGHTDTAEPGSLALVRALEVAKALVATGAIPSGAEISIAGVGASQPLVPTGPSVREPQNRFVAIQFDTGATATESRPSRPQAATTPPPDQRESVIARLPGNYACNGSNPNGTTYRCRVTISRSGGVYSFRWVIGDGTRYSGKGRLRGRTLTVDWGQSAPVIYQVGDDGVLRGTWGRGEGRETLTPDR